MTPESYRAVKETEAETRTIEAKRQVLAIDFLPSPLPLLERLFRLMDEEQGCASDMEDIIKQDPGLCSQVLRVANSAYYGCRGRIKDLSRAIVVIGLQETRNICLNALLVQQFSEAHLPDDFDLRQFWQHSMLSGLLATELARFAQHILGHEAYILGLLHDLGRVVIATYFPTDFEAINNRASCAQRPILEIERSYGLTHTEVGSWLALKWALPQTVRMVVLWHHDPMCAPFCQHEVALIHIATRLANLTENLDAETPGPSKGQSLEEILSVAGLTTGDFQGCIFKIKDLAEEVERRWTVLSHG